MDKAHIIREIQRTAQLNGGVVLGRGRFEEETGITVNDWYGKIWTRWSDAAKEAGVEPNKFQEAHPEDYLLEQLALLCRRLSKLPSVGEMRIEARQNSDFPASSSYRNRFGGIRELAAKLIAFCRRNSQFEDVAQILEDRKFPSKNVVAEGERSLTVGFVYLLRHGSRREYKLGCTNDPLRRHGEIRLQTPEKINAVHTIQTDDPSGVESYWHRRFAEKRKEGEWFTLTAQDVAAFKRWKRIY